MDCRVHVLHLNTTFTKWQLLSSASLGIFQFRTLFYPFPILNDASKRVVVQWLSILVSTDETHLNVYFFNGTITTVMLEASIESSSKKPATFLIISTLFARQRTYFQKSDFNKFFNNQIYMFMDCRSK